MAPGMWKRAFMAATVLLLLALVVVTPRLIGPKEDISSLPRVILNYYEGHLVVGVTSLSGLYIYDALYLNVTRESGPPLPWNGTHLMALQGRVPLDGPGDLRVEAAAMDARGVWFDGTLNVTALADGEGWVFRVRSSPEALPREMSAQELTESPVATLMERRRAA